MGPNEKLIKYIQDKCYGILAVRYNYKSIENDLIHQVENLKSGNVFWIDAIYKTAVELSEQRQVLNIMEYDLSQLCHVLGGEYLKLWEEIVQGNKDE